MTDFYIYIYIWCSQKPSYVCSHCRYQFLRSKQTFPEELKQILATQQLTLYSSLSWEAKTSLPISPSISGHKTSPQSQRFFFSLMTLSWFLLCWFTAGRQGSDTISSVLFYGDPKANGHRFSAFLRAIKENWCAGTAICFTISRGRGLMKMADLVAWRLLGQRKQRGVKGLLWLF